MERQFSQFIKEMKSKRFVTLDEATTKHIIILRVFSMTGWNIYDPDEVKPEYAVSGKSVDYSLRINGQNKVFVEVKKIGEDLENHQEQLLNYSFQEGIELAVLTNGISWWFYLPLNRGSWEQRKFYSIDLIQQNEDEVIKNFVNFLNKNNVQSRKSVKLAKALLKSRQKENIIRDSLPKSWNRIVSEPDEMLIGLVSEVVEKLSGYSPTDEQVAKFIDKNKSQLIVSEETSADADIAQIEKDKQTQVSKYIRQGYTGKRITAFIFHAKKYEVKYWIDMLMKLSEVLLERHKAEFSKVLELRGYQRPYFTRNKNELRVPWKIKGTDIYVEANLSSNLIVKICNNMASLFGYKDPIKIESE